MIQTLRVAARPVAHLAAIAIVIGALTACRPMTPPEATLFVATNDLRAEAGLAPYAQQEPLVDQARELARAMAASGKVAHSDPSTWSVSWTAAGENVGAGPSIDAIVDKLERSPAHRASMLSESYTHMAVGTARGDDGLLYVAQLFWRG